MHPCHLKGTGQTDHGCVESAISKEWRLVKSPRSCFKHEMRQLDRICSLALVIRADERCAEDDVEG